MQPRTLVLLALLVAPAVAVSASSAAQSWLQSHKSPTEDQLGELQSANPAAFALVNALLAKHAKGEIKLAPEERGPDVFRRMMTPSHLAAARPSLALPYASSEVSEMPNVDQKSYNPNAAADRDESSVQRLLDAVASMGGAKGKKIALLRSKRHHAKQQENTLLDDANMFGEEPAPKPVQAVEVPQVQEQAAPAPKKANSYLAGIDLSGDMPAVTGAKQVVAPKPKSEGADLASFSFDDGAPGSEAAKPAPKKVEAPKPKKDNSFLKWLGITKKAPAPEEAPAAPVAKKNSYLAAFLS